MTPETELQAQDPSESGALSESADSSGLSETGGVRVRRALISVHDKSSLIELARGLRELGVEILSTGGTARALQEAAVPARSVSDYTGFPEIMGGRVKTLHPRILGGLLERRDNEADRAEAKSEGIEPIDLLCVNLYPFEATVAGGRATMAEAIENIDIGGPTMIRAAAKNHRDVVVIVDPADYQEVLEELRYCGGRLPEATRLRLAARAFAYTARYDAAIYRWFASRTYEGFPPRWASFYEKVQDLRYGENPHQQAAYFAEVGAERHLLGGVKQLHGKELSYNNLLDVDAARALIEELEGIAGAGGASAAIVKHNNPCGCALGADAREAYERALACDPQSAFGGILALNVAVDPSLARALQGHFVEVILAPDFEQEALALLRERKNVRLLVAPEWLAQLRDRGTVGVVEHSVLGGILAQTRDSAQEGRESMRVATSIEPDQAQWADLLFAWRICAHVRSNAIVLARREATVGIGAGQMSRVDSVRIAVEKARSAQPELLEGCAMASDAFFPFADNVEVAAQAGVKAIIQPGGSVRDEEVIAAAEQAGIAMVLTGTRHFRH
ncbi:MAG TPA: bifunctional phosphoribosylaminoimidazolecarboxamide formyltransferase/IMP cyclohydrolase [Solirubrobacteraceae bacterium]|nr:bifunctional phosphoribosylaminoimidazolecarboxamide formyltransferase/IMP cyclohydrolase [Solirubrobacteraceae bacterium]